MLEEKSVYEKTYNDYGRIILTLDQELSKRNIKAYKLSVLTGIDWKIVKRYMSGNLYRVDLDLLARMCFVLNCDLNDIIHYEPCIQENIKKKNRKIEE